MVSLTMLALTYTHSRVSIIEGNTTSSSSPPPSSFSSPPYKSYDINEITRTTIPMTRPSTIPSTTTIPTRTTNKITSEEYFTQPTLYHPNDSLKTRREEIGNKLQHQNQINLKSKKK